MCFSAEASFISAAVMSGIGIVTFKTRKTKRLLLLSMVPFIYALQQFSEGMIWLTYNTEEPEGLLFSLSKNLFAFIALVLWPIWYPIAFGIAEQIGWRKYVIGVCFLFAITLSAYIMTNLPSNEVTITIINHSIQYGLETPIVLDTWIIIGIYTIVVIAPQFVSSLKKTTTLAVLYLAGWLLSEYFRHETFASTWCFFASLVSIYLLFVIKANNPESLETQSIQ